jgi:hypothetical protein
MKLVEFFAVCLCHEDNLVGDGDMAAALARILVASLVCDGFNRWHRFVGFYMETGIGQRAVGARWRVFISHGYDEAQNSDQPNISYSCVGPVVGLVAW